MQKVHYQYLGEMPYREAWDLQERFFEDNLIIKKQNRLDGGSKPTHHHLFLLEHPHVYTLGKSGSKNHLLISAEELEAKGVEFYPTNRGGDITYHGPGQIVGYPVMDLECFFTDVARYMRSLEEVIIRVLSSYGIEAGRYEGYTGVWLDADDPQRARKICAMGVKLSRWVSMHGFALNVNANLDYFGYIVPCGINDKQVTSMQKELGAELDMEEVRRKVLNEFQQVFEVSLIEDDAR